MMKVSSTFDKQETLLHKSFQFPEVSLSFKPIFNQYRVQRYHLQTKSLDLSYICVRLITCMLRSSVNHTTLSDQCARPREQT